MTSAIDPAIKHFGSQTALAKAIGVTPQTVNQWVRGIRSVPVGKCLAIETKTGGAVKRRDLRPNDWADYWPDLADQPATN